MKKNQYAVCACENLPGLHHPNLNDCENEVPVIFSEEEMKEQQQCQHEEEMFDGVCALCGFIDQAAYIEAEENNKK